MANRVFKVLLLWSAFSCILAAVRGSDETIEWSKSTVSQVSTFVNDTAQLVWEATGPLYNVTVRVGSVSDFNQPRYIYVKNAFEDEIHSLAGPDLEDKFKMSYNGSVLMFTIEMVQHADQGLYVAELVKTKPVGDYINLIVGDRVDTTISSISTKDTVTDIGDRSSPSTQSGLVLILVPVLLLLGAVLFIVILTIVCYCKKKKEKSKYAPQKVKYKTVSNNEEKLGTDKTPSNIETRLSKIPICETAAKETENTLLEGVSIPPTDNYEFEKFGAFCNDTDNIDNFFNAFQQTHERILTNPQRKQLQELLVSKGITSCALEQNSFDSEWRYATRYCLVVFGLTGDEGYVTGVYVEYNTNLPEEKFDELSVPDRLNWFRFKAMSKLKDERIIENINLVNSIDDVPQMLITR